MLVVTIRPRLRLGCADCAGLASAGSVSGVGLGVGSGVVGSGGKVVLVPSAVASAGSGFGSEGSGSAFGIAGKLGEVALSVGELGKFGEVVLSAAGAETRSGADEQAATTQTHNVSAASFWPRRLVAARLCDAQKPTLRSVAFNAEMGDNASQRRSRHESSHAGS